jgi:subtilisin family serine protease
MTDEQRGTDVQPGADCLVLLKANTVTPIGVGPLIAPNTLVVPLEEVAPFVEISERQIPNTILSFNLDLLGGLAITENEDNWGASMKGYDAPRFWARGVFGTGVRIGIADSGIDVTHPTFSTMQANRRLKAFAAFESDGKKSVQRAPDGSVVPDSEAAPTFTHWHGTFCTSILVGDQTDGKLRGLAKQSELVVAQVLQLANNGTVASIYAGLTWLNDQSCDIVSLSLGWEGKHDEWAKPIQELLRRGVVVVCAAGNSFGVPGVPPSNSPGNYPLEPTNSADGVLICVGAIDEEKLVGDFSGGETVDWSGVRNVQPDGTVVPSVFATSATHVVPTLVAAGVGVVSASPVIPAGQYRLDSGTSMATPQVVGLIALTLSAIRVSKPEATARNAADLALSSLVPLPGDSLVLRSGRGIVNIDQLLAAIDAF